MALTRSENDCTPTADQQTAAARVGLSLLITEECSHIYKHVQMCSTVESVTHSVSLLLNEWMNVLPKKGNHTHTLWDLLPSGLYFISSLISQHRPQSQCLDHLYHYCCYDLILTDWMLVSGSLHQQRFNTQAQYHVCVFLHADHEKHFGHTFNTSNFTRFTGITTFSVMNALLYNL